MKAAIYVRVSTQEQAAHGYSIGEQEDRLSKYAGAMQYDIVNVYKDEGFSGGTLDRPAMKQLINDIRAHKIDIVLIYKLDRLSRNVKNVLELVELFGEYGVTLFSLTENIDLSSPFGRAALKMSATFSELERDTITERMMLGKIAKAKSGKFSWSGNIPFGYRYDKATRHSEIDPHEAEIVRRIFALYLDGYSFRSIYLMIIKEYPEERLLNLKGGHSFIADVIERPLYAGYFMFNEKMYKAVNVEPIISYDTWIHANALRQSKPKKVTHSPYLLTGLLYCGKCGTRYSGKCSWVYQNGVKYSSYSYGCTARIRYDKIFHDHRCDNKIILARELDNRIGNLIKNLDFTEADISPLNINIERLEKENNKLNQQRDKLLSVFMENIIDRDTYVLRDKMFVDKIAENNALIEEEASRPKTDKKITVPFLKKQTKNWDTLPLPEKQQLLRLLIDKIIVNDNDITVKWRIRLRNSNI